LKAVEYVMQSFGRCCAKPTFFDDFYENFFASSPLIRAKFINTDMQAQKDLLRKGILNLLLYARGMSDVKLQQLAKSHSKANLDIHPELYTFWLNSLLKTVAKHDDQHTPEADFYWRDVLNKGIAIIKNGYDKEH